MLEYLLVSSLQIQTLGALEDKLFHNLLYDTMHFNDLIGGVTFLALPFSFRRNLLCVTIMAIDTVALGTLFRLENYTKAYSTNKMIHCLCYLSWDEVG